MRRARDVPCALVAFWCMHVDLDNLRDVDLDMYLCIKFSITYIETKVFKFCVALI